MTKLQKTKDTKCPKCGARPGQSCRAADFTVRQNPYACMDGGCVLLVPGVPVGMHTNAGCRCIPLKMTPDERVRLRKGIRWLGKRLSETLHLRSSGEEVTT